MDGYYTVKDVCRKFNVSRETIRRWEEKRWFPRRVHFTCDARGRCGFSIAEVDAWDLARRTERASSSTTASL
jgi:predicted DNA-binding transcriptional regulator AlpA